MILNIRLTDAKWHRDIAFDHMCIAADNGLVYSEAYAYSQWDLWNSRIEIEECEYCNKYKGHMAPNHFASRMCKSGKRNHCTCDACF